MPSNAVIWLIVALTIGGVLVRPFDLPEAVWAVAGGAIVLVSGLLPLPAGLQAIAKGGDVYLFLTGMMLLSETARREGLFDWVAAFAVNHAAGSPRRLFVLIYVVGIVVTTFLSNDAAAVVMTPAVIAVSRKADCKPLPLLLICAFIANAASFVLPISNPANLVLYGAHVPALADWLGRFALPSVLSIAATFILLRVTQGADLTGTCKPSAEAVPLTRGSWTAMAGLGLTAVALMAVSAFDQPLGLPTCALGVLTAAAVLVSTRSSPWPMLKAVSWSVLPLVAGLFVLVAAVEQTGATRALAEWVDRFARESVEGTAAVTGLLLGFGSNIVNNLPAGLVASTSLALAKPPQVVIDAALIGVDLGPNLSVTGSLATILWLTALRRDGENVGFWRFLGIGAIVMPPALIVAMAARIWLG